MERPAMADGDLGKVQELLFGQQLSTTTKQLDALQKRLEQQISESHILLMTRVDDLEKACELKFDSLAKELQIESNTRREEDTRVERAMDTAESNLKKYVTALENRTAQADTARQTDLQNARAHWSSTLDSTRDQMLQQLNDATAVLEARKLDRQALSGLLGSIASGLTGLETASKAESSEPDNVSQRK